MNKFLVVDGCTLKFKTLSNSGIITITPGIDLSLKSKAEGKQIYKQISFTVAGATNGTVINATGVGVISGNSEKIKCDLLPVVLEDAESLDIVFTGIIPPSTPSTFTDKIIINNPGQSKVKGL